MEALLQANCSEIEDEKDKLVEELENEHNITVRKQDPVVDLVVFSCDAKFYSTKAASVNYDKHLSDTHWIQMKDLRANVNKTSDCKRYKSIPALQLLPSSLTKPRMGIWSNSSSCGNRDLLKIKKT